MFVFDENFGEIQFNYVSKEVRKCTKPAKKR